jgi:hypothetical protein
MNEKLQVALFDLTQNALRMGRMEARNQFATTIRTLLDDPKFVAMSNVQTLRYLIEALQLEDSFDKPGATDVQQ